MTFRIDQLLARAFVVPTDAPEADGTLEWSSTTLIIVQVQAGRYTGLGYTYSHAAVVPLIQRTFRELVEGREVLANQSIMCELWRASRNLGGLGLVAHALSAIDIALWDLKARALEIPLVDLLGSVRECVPVYGSGGFTSYSLERLSTQLQEWVADGFSRVKMKIGSEPRIDVQRVRAARDAIGSETELFVDANGAYQVKEALRLAEQFAEAGVTWFEEPVSSDDLQGLRHIRHGVPAGMNVTAGEYGYRLFDFKRLLVPRAVDCLMADATRCGGISGFLDVGVLCRTQCVPLSAHTAPNLHAHVCAALGEVVHIEYFHDHARIEGEFFDGALKPRGGSIAPDRSRTGMGLELKESDVLRYEA